MAQLWLITVNSRHIGLILALFPVLGMPEATPCGSGLEYSILMDTQARMTPASVPHPWYRTVPFSG